MSLGELLENLINEYNEGDKLKVYSTSSEDNHKNTHEYIWGENVSLSILTNSFNDFEVYGECAGSDPKGHWIRNIKFELIR